MTQEWFDRVCMSALGHRTSVEETYDVARLVIQRGIPGDFVECGVYAGAQSAVMARAIIDGGQSHARRVHLFDSFAGIPKPGPRDFELLNARHTEGLASCSLADVERNMRDWDIPPELLTYWQGNFKSSTLQAAADDEPRRLQVQGIALLRLDGDLYESTRCCLQHLYPLVSKGGYVIVDDFNLRGCREAVLELLQPAPVLWRKWE